MRVATSSFVSLIRLWEPREDEFAQGFVCLRLSFDGLLAQPLVSAAPHALRLRRQGRVQVGSRNSLFAVIVFLL